MAIKQGGSAAMASKSLARGTAGRTSAGLPASSTPCRANTFFAKSMPTHTMVMGFPFQSELMRFRNPIVALVAVSRSPRVARDGEVPFIR
jgi:hypothetical protein